MSRVTINVKRMSFAEACCLCFTRHVTGTYFPDGTRVEVQPPGGNGEWIPGTLSSSRQTRYGYVCEVTFDGGGRETLSETFVRRLVEAEAKAGDSLDVLFDKLDQCRSARAVNGILRALIQRVQAMSPAEIMGNSRLQISHIKDGVQPRICASSLYQNLSRAHRDEFVDTPIRMLLETIQAEYDPNEGPEDCGFSCSWDF